MIIESLTGKLRVRQNFLPFALPSIGDEEINEVIATLKSGWLTTGPKTKLFEKEFASYIGVRNALAVNSCTAGLHLALLACGIKPGDEVILPTMTFAATANVVIHCGAKPVLADVGDDLNIKISEIERLITPKTRAIIPVHFAGQPCAMAEITALAKKHNLVVIEDSAHAVGATYRGKKIGTISPVTVFSFYPTKNMTTGEGGMVCTEDDELAEKIRILSLHGISKDAWKRYRKEGSWYYQILYPGFKYNMTDIQAAIGLCQLKKLDSFLAQRKHYAQIYTDAFRFVSEIILPPVASHSTHSWHLYVILLKLESLRINRDQFIQALNYENIGASVHFIPIHLHPYYQKAFGYRIGDFPNAEWLYQRIVSLPLYPKMTRKDINDTITAVIKIIRRYRL
ncbi:MAG: DegT/DnrJ/EryC1/StrS aminotransferase family protein [candidate division WOR-3 bacterium]